MSNIPFIVAIDFTRHLLKYDGFKSIGVYGEPMSGAKSVLETFKKMGMVYNYFLPVEMKINILGNGVINIKYL